VDLELCYDDEHAASHCGTCTRCLEACPTDAFVEPYVLDARRCISYLTIELRGPIPQELREPMGDWLFGCDICQEVCPWNRRAPLSSESAFEPCAELAGCDPIELLSLSADAFRARFRQSPLGRPKRSGLLRNAAIVLGNRKTPRAVPALVAALDDTEAIVRGAAAWALGRFLPREDIQQALGRRLAEESDSDVRRELQAALGGSMFKPADARYAEESILKFGTVSKSQRMQEPPGC
jgi:epoxyqueuosine reductase